MAKNTTVAKKKAGRVKAGKLYTDLAATTTHRFDVGTYIQEEDKRTPGFAAAVEEEVARLDLADRVKALRKTRRLTQAGLAKRMGVSQSAVAQMEAAPTLEIRTLAKLALALGCRLHIDFREAR